MLETYKEAIDIEKRCALFINENQRLIDETDYLLKKTTDKIKIAELCEWRVGLLKQIGVIFQEKERARKIQEILKAKTYKSLLFTEYYKWA